MPQNTGRTSSSRRSAALKKSIRQKKLMAARRRRQRLIGAACACAAVLLIVLTIAIAGNRRPAADPAQLVAAATAAADTAQPLATPVAADGTEALATPVPVATDAPTPVPQDTPAPTPEPTAAPAAATVFHYYPTDEQRAAFAPKVEPDVVTGFLPVCYSGRTDRKVVAFTIDDCNQVGNLRTIVELFQRYNGKATIFPIGENVVHLTEVLRTAWNDGFEIENHTWNHSGLYPENDEGLAFQIWSQNRAVSEALGVDYQMHFLRPRGGDNRYDQRTHAYLRQMGYYGVAYWSQVGVLAPTKIKASEVQNGDILLFHTTDKDVAELKELVPQLADRGFTFVTMNDLFGLPVNETAPLTPDAEVEPLAPWTRFDQIYKKGEYLHDVYLIQERLSQLGFLTSEYNGYYGDKTVRAVKAFQESKGLPADGVTGKETWDALFGT